jgi:hypothetical protein
MKFKIALWPNFLCRSGRKVPPRAGNNASRRFIWNKKMKVEIKHLLQSRPGKACFCRLLCAVRRKHCVYRIKLIYFSIFALKILKEILQTVPPSETWPVPFHSALPEGGVLNHSPWSFRSTTTEVDVD